MIVKTSNSLGPDVDGNPAYMEDAGSVFLKCTLPKKVCTNEHANAAGNKIFSGSVVCDGEDDEFCQAQTDDINDSSVEGAQCVDQSDVFQTGLETDYTKSWSLPYRDKWEWGVDGPRPSGTPKYFHEKIKDWTNNQNRKITDDFRHLGVSVPNKYHIFNYFQLND